MYTTAVVVAVNMGRLVKTFFFNRISRARNVLVSIDVHGGVLNVRCVKVHFPNTYTPASRTNCTKLKIFI